MQLPNTGDALEGHTTGQPAAGLVLSLHIVMSLGPVVPDDEPQPRSSSTRSGHVPSEQEEEPQRADGLVLGRRSTHRPFDLLTTNPGTI